MIFVRVVHLTNRSSHYVAVRSLVRQNSYRYYRILSSRRNPTTAANAKFWHDKVALKLG